jgi:hypothetical protein
MKKIFKFTFKKFIFSSNWRKIKYSNEINNENSFAPNIKFTDNSLLKEVIKFSNEYEEDEKDQIYQILEKNFIKTLKQWRKLTEKQKEKYPDGLKNILDNLSGKKQKKLKI